MTATQTLNIYQILNKHFKNSQGASAVVEEIEEKKEILSTKEYIHSLQQKILNLKVDIERRFNQMVICTVGTK